MPKVGTKRYPYTPEGIKQARRAAKQAGKRVRITRTKPKKAAT